MAIIKRIFRVNGSKLTDDRCLNKDREEGDGSDFGGVVANRAIALTVIDQSEGCVDGGGVSTENRCRVPRPWERGGVQHLTQHGLIRRENKRFYLEYLISC